MRSRLNDGKGDPLNIDLSCKACGNNRFSFSEAHTDDAPVLCIDCGHRVGTLGSLKAMVEQAVLDSVGQTQSGDQPGVTVRGAPR